MVMDALAVEPFDDAIPVVSSLFVCGTHSTDMKSEGREYIVGICGWSDE